MTGPHLTDLATRVFDVPLGDPETDGTLAWNSTTVVAVEVRAAGQTGLGWTYGPAAAAAVISDVLQPLICGLDAFDVGRAYLRMRQGTRNAPSPGLASYAISAVDVALWDLKARLLGVPLATLLGRVTGRVPLYGSGGFTSMTDQQLRAQLTGWVDGDGMPAVKIKIGEDRGGHLRRDLHRIQIARETIGPDTALMVDANGGYTTKQAVRLARLAAGADIVWFEEPVSSDRLDQLALLRGRLAAEVTAGEYGTTVDYFRRMCASGAVDCLQVDASRCGGYTGFLAAATVADSYGLAVSTHCAPHLHAVVAAGIANLRHCEWFHDHVDADRRLFDGLPVPARGALAVDGGTPGHGITMRADPDLP